MTASSQTDTTSIEETAAEQATGDAELSAAAPPVALEGDGAAARNRRLRWRDHLLIACFGLLVFGFSLVSGKPLSMHEARLPQLSKEMMQEGRWLLPHSGGRPWLERPPLPFIATRAVGLVTGRLDEVWIVRIPNVLAGTAVLLLCGFIGSRLFGRGIGLVAPLILATMYEFYTYASAAEDEIYLALLAAAALAVFVKVETEPADEPPRSWASAFFANRQPAVWLFFIFAGLSGLVKGPGFGAAQIAAATGSYVLLSRSWMRIGRYLWVWGWLIFAALTLAWPIHAYRAYPSVWDNWVYDYAGPFGHQPPWYYLKLLPAALMPWLPLSFVGVILLLRRQLQGKALSAVAGPAAPRLMLLCFMFAPLIVMSVPARKHHHYLVPVMFPWAIATAAAITILGPALLERLHARLARQRPELRRKVMLVELVAMLGLLSAGFAAASVGARAQVAGGLLAGAVVVGGIAWLSVGAKRRSPSHALAALIVTIAAIASVVQWSYYAQHPKRRASAVFARAAAEMIPRDAPLLIAAPGGLDFFKLQFYARRPHRLLHNITYVRDASITESAVYVITRARDQAYLEEVAGPTRLLLESDASSNHEPDLRFALFEVRLDPAKKRFPTPPTPDVLQGMERRPGPYLGKPPAYLRQPDGI